MSIYNDSNNNGILDIGDAQFIFTDDHPNRLDEAISIGMPQQCHLEHHIHLMHLLGLLDHHNLNLNLFNLQT
tara:strand:- start:639 stop:854 length:216 start_codon:yes stop_codon:yes gene_type:complete